MEGPGGVPTQLFVAGVLAGGLLALALGVRLKDLEAVELKGLDAFILAALVEALTPRLVQARLLDPRAGSLLELLALALLAYGLWQNRRLWGARLLGLGFTLNTLAILAYGGRMPVSEQALSAAGIGKAQAFLAEGGEGLHVLAHPGNPFNALGDVIPLRLTHQVISVGDLFILLGSAWLVVELGLEARRKMGAVR